MDIDNITRAELARKMNTSLIESYVTEGQLEDFIGKCLNYPLAAIAVDANLVSALYRLLRGSNTKCCAVISYPNGGRTLETKLNDIKYVIENGAEELDICMDYGAFKSGNYDKVRNDLKKLIKASQGYNPVIAVQSPILSDEQKVKACELVLEAGGNFIKTSCGYGYKTEKRDVLLIRETLHNKVKIEVAGGVRTLDDTKAMFKAGADRIATSSVFNILNAVEV